MKKSELLQMPALRATRRMLKMAAEDKPEIEVIRYWDSSTYERRKHKHWLYLRCIVEGDILKLACFLTEPLREKCRLPKYEIYIDRKAKEYLTYNPEQEKWYTGCFQRLEWPSYRYARADIVADPHTVKQINAFFGTRYEEKQILRGLDDFQKAIMSARLEACHRKITDPWDEDLKQTRALPKDWKRWVDKVAIPEQYIFYDYTRKKYTTGYCSYCEHEVQVQPHHNEVGICPHCRRKVIFKALGRFKRFWTQTYQTYLMQKCKDGFMIREFNVYRCYTSRDYAHPRITFSEIRRAIGTPEGTVTRAYYWGIYRQRNCRWIKCNVCNPRWEGDARGKIYGKSLVCLDKSYLRKTGLVEAYRMQHIIDPEHYLVRYERQPYLEKIVKAGLRRLSLEIFGRGYVASGGPLCRRDIDTSQSSLTRLLKITPTQLTRLRTRDGGAEPLRWLQYEKTSSQAIPDDVLDWLLANNLFLRDLSFISDRMSLPQIKHYLERQVRELNMPLAQVTTTWKDYLAMAARLGYDLNDEIVYRVRRLKYRHDQLVLLIEQNDMAITAGEILRSHPHVEEHLRAVKSTYAYSDEQYTVVVPEKIEEIIAEGRFLHHCVDKQTRYWDRIERQEAYIFFLRKTAEPDIPYYTLEVEPGGTVRQKRTMYDHQLDDIADATEFLRKWQLAIKERLTDADRKMAEQSKILRLANFDELRRNNVKINTGKLQGQPLVEVLMADLMVA